MYLISWLAELTNQPLLARRRKYLISQLAVLTYQPLSVRRWSYLIHQLATTYLLPTRRWRYLLSCLATIYLPTSSYKKEEASAQLANSYLPFNLFLQEGGGI
jgi:hypothetical protein